MSANSGDRTAKLIIIPSVPGQRTDTGYVLDQKAAAGLDIYAKFWPGRVQAMFREGDPGGIAFGKLYPPETLSYDVEVLPKGTQFSAAHIQGASLVVASGDNHMDFPLADICVEKRIPIVFLIEYILETRLQIIAVGRQSRFSKFKSALWTILTERERRKAFRKAAGLQANGTPAGRAYAPLTGDMMTYFDTRMPRGLMATDEEIENKIARLKAGGHLRLGYSGRLEPMKGADHLIEVAATLGKAGMDFSLDIFGDGSLEPAMRQRIADLDLGESVTLHRPVDFASELVPYFRGKIDLFLCCHRQSDPSCTYMEAMGCGVPIFGYANKALTGLLEIAPAGRAVRMNSPAALAGAVVAQNGNREPLFDMMREARNLSAAHDFEETFRSRMEQFVRLAAGIHRNLRENFSPKNKSLQK